MTSRSPPPVWAYVSMPGRWTRPWPPLVITTFPTAELTEPPQGALRVFAGQPDPADPSHFTIDYESDAGRHTMDGWLQPNDKVTFKIRRTAPAAPRPAGDAIVAPAASRPASDPVVAPAVPLILPSMRVRVNGQDRDVPAGTSVLQLIEQHNLTPQKVAVELNRRIIRSEKYETVLNDGDEVEIVTFVGGG